MSARTGTAVLTRPVVGIATDVGRVRAFNEDSFLAEDPVYVVVDGMGGHDAGRRASRTAVSVMEDLVGLELTDTAPVVAAVRRAGEAVAAIPSQDPHRPGATISGAVRATVEGEPVWVVLNIGDARTYRTVPGGIEQVTTDHSQVQALVDSGRLTRGEARHDPRRNVVTRALGAGLEGPATPDLVVLGATPGDRLLICSDGLSDELDDDVLAYLLRGGRPAQRTAETLVGAALSAGGHDNVTALVLDLPVTADDAAAADADGTVATGTAPEVPALEVPAPSVALESSVVLEPDDAEVGPVGPLA